MEEKIIIEIKKFSEIYEIKPEIIFGIVKKESNGDQFACRFEPNYKWLYYPDQVKPISCSLDTEKTLQKISWGLMQVMGAVYREYGYKGWLSIIPGNIEIQLRFGCKHLSNKIEKYGINEGLLAYNSGSPRKNEEGKYINESYLKDVLKFADEFRRE